MSTLKEIYNSITNEGKEWLEENLGTLDDSVTNFALDLLNANIEGKVEPRDRIRIVNLVTLPDFCGLTTADIYNIVAHEEHMLEWESLDLFNREMATHSCMSSFTTRALLASYLYEQMDNGQEPLEDIFLDDPNVAFVTQTESYKKLMSSDCAAVDYTHISESTRVPVSKILNTDYWIGVIVNDTTCPAKWTPGKPKERHWGCFPRSYKKNGDITLTIKREPKIELTASQSIIYVPAKKIAEVPPRLPLGTFLPEEIVDKYNLPKARY